MSETEEPLIENYGVKCVVCGEPAVTICLDESREIHGPLCASHNHPNCRVRHSNDFRWWLEIHGEWDDSLLKRKEALPVIKEVPDRTEATEVEAKAKAKTKTKKEPKTSSKAKTKAEEGPIDAEKVMELLKSSNKEELKKLIENTKLDEEI